MNNILFTLNIKIYNSKAALYVFIIYVLVPVPKRLINELSGKQAGRAVQHSFSETLLTYFRTNIEKVPYIYINYLSFNFFSLKRLKHCC